MIERQAGARTLFLRVETIAADQGGSGGATTMMPSRAFHYP